MKENGGKKSCETIPLKAGRLTAQKRFDLLFLRGMLKRGDDDDEEVDDEMRTTVTSQNRVQQY
jgi:hypothetical protein